MTPDQIKALAKQAGCKFDDDESYPMTRIMFCKTELAEFVRLVRESALEEAAELCHNNAEQLGAMNGRTLSPFDHECQGLHAGMTYAKAIRKLK